MKRALLLAGSAAVVTLAALAIAAHRHGVLWFFGIYPVPSGTAATYQLWSGFIPALTVLGLTTLIAGAWHHLDCHAAGCKRLARAPVEGTPWRTCWRHAPTGKPPTRAHILAAHRAHRERQARTPPSGAAGERLYRQDRDSGGPPSDDRKKPPP